MRHVVGSHDAEAKVDTRTHQTFDLFVDEDRLRRRDRQITGRRKFDDARVDQHAIRLPAMEGGGRHFQRLFCVLKLLLRVLDGHLETVHAGQFVADLNKRLINLLDAVDRAGHERVTGFAWGERTWHQPSRCEDVAELTLELQHLRQEHAPGPHHHPVRPVVAGWQFDPFAADGPRIEKLRGAVGNQCERNSVPCGTLRTQAPAQRFESLTGNQASDPLLFDREQGRCDLRPQMNVRFAGK